MGPFDMLCFCFGDREDLRPCPGLRFAVFAYPACFAQCADVLFDLPALFDALVVESPAYAGLEMLAGSRGQR
jgi:hypothetical protein